MERGEGKGREKYVEKRMMKECVMKMPATFKPNFKHKNSVVHMSVTFRLKEGGRK
jgi:hypothetical protein